MEQLCYFVSSRGLLKSCTFHSLNPKSSCNNDTSYLQYMLISGKMFDGMSIYVCSDLLNYFIVKILPLINHSFILVSGDSDLCVPKEAILAQLHNALISNSKLLKWFIQNTMIQNHSKIVQLPIGLDYHTIANNPNHLWKTNGEGYLPKFQEGKLQEIRNNMVPFHERERKIYINFSSQNDRFEDRKKLLSEISNELTNINQQFIPRTENWKNITKYAFVASPYGMGFDCHRTWETLCLGGIPIVRAKHFSKLFKDLPVLIVDNWSDITSELLEKTIQDFKECEFNWEKITLKYWTNQINLTG